MLKEGQTVYYIDENMVHSGKAIDIKKDGDEDVFSIDSYGGCEGQYVIAADQIGLTVFENEQDAKDHIKRL